MYKKSPQLLTHCGKMSNSAEFQNFFKYKMKKIPSSTCFINLLISCFFFRKFCSSDFSCSRFFSEIDEVQCTLSF